MIRAISLSCTWHYAYRICGGNVAILPGCAVTLTVAANPTGSSIVEINATIAIGIICFLCVSPLCFSPFIGICFI
jgi:nickel-dependent lactate racemase